MNKPITIMLPIVPPTKTHQNKKIVNIGKHAKLAESLGMKPGNILIADIGDTAVVTPKSIKRGERFSSGTRLGEPKKNRIGLIPKTTKPDWDNLAKTLQDVLTRLRFWEDDAQVYSASVDKWWGEEPQITITVQEGSEQ